MTKLFPDFWCGYFPISEKMWLLYIFTLKIRTFILNCNGHLVVYLVWGMFHKCSIQMLKIRLSAKCFVGIWMHMFNLLVPWRSGLLKTCIIVLASLGQCYTGLLRFHHVWLVVWMFVCLDVFQYTNPWWFHDSNSQTIPCKVTYNIAQFIRTLRNIHPGIDMQHI